MKKIITVVGTRPDAIKLLPVHQALKKVGFQSLLCATFQHDHLLTQVLKLFKVTPDFQLSIMKKGQDLFDITINALTHLKEVYDCVNPDLVIVQGDTTTSMSAALSAFYKKIPVAHVEAGLRTGNRYAPYPEEINRKFITPIASYHFAPTSLAVANLLAEGVDRSTIFLTGNTGIDSLFWADKQCKEDVSLINENLRKKIKTCQQSGQKIVLLTVHRRESFGEGLKNIFQAIKNFLSRFVDVVVMYPVHPNPYVQQAIEESEFNKSHQVILLPPLDYQEIVYLMNASSWIATDSGGIQEEGVSLGKRVIVLRRTTERLEGVWMGGAKLAGTEMSAIEYLMEESYNLKGTQEASRSSVYGNGYASLYIAEILKMHIQEKLLTPSCSLPFSCS